MGARICLLYDGFFSFAVVWQVFLLFILLCYICSNFAMVPFASRSISVSISGRAASIRAIVRRQSEVWYELSKIFVRAAVEMLFGANFPHPTFVDQAIGTHRQSGIPDMLEMLLVVQFIQIALHGSVGRTGQLHRIGKNPVMGLFTAKFPCIVGLPIVISITQGFTSILKAKS